MSEEESSLVAAELQLSDTSAKSLRMGEPDLEITVKDGDKQKVFHHYSTIMAYNFGFFDSMLSSGMKESESKKVTIEDVDPELFELSLSFLENPKLLATEENVLSVASLYHRFDSERGLELSELILSDFLNKWKDSTSGRSLTNKEMDLAVDMIAFSLTFQLTELIENGIQFLAKKFSRAGIYGRGLFTLRHIKSLQSFLSMYPEDIYQPFHDKFFQGQPLPDFGAPTFPETLIHQFRAIENITLPQYVKIQDVVFEVVTIEENSSHEYSHSTTFDIGLKHCSYSTGKHHYRGVKETSPCNFAEVEVGQACLMPLQHGCAGSDFDFLDWCLIYKRQNTKIEFVFPGSGSCSMPPCEKGWRMLNQIEQLGSRRRFRYEVRLVQKSRK